MHGVSGLHGYVGFENWWNEHGHAPLAIRAREGVRGLVGGISVGIGIKNKVFIESKKYLPNQKINIY